MEKQAPSPSPKNKSALWKHISNTWFLFVKELRGVLLADPLLAFLIVYAFSLPIYMVATSAPMDVKDMVVGFVDEDHSSLSQRIRDAMTPPLFKETRLLKPADIDPLMDKGQLIFVVEIPPSFEADLLAGRSASLQINVDATAMLQAGTGTGYIQSVISNEITRYATERGVRMPVAPFDVRVISRFNPNLESHWFTSVMQIVNNITMLIMILTGAALIREREQGTVEHLLVMPLVPTEIMLAKVIANSLIILVSAILSLLFVVEWSLNVPIAGSIPLFILGAIFFAMATAALGIVLGTIASTMGQFGLLAMPVMTLLMLLSGGSTPMESMPLWLQYVMKIFTPTPHFISFSQAVLFRGAGFSLVWTQLLALALIGTAYFLFSLKRFRRVIFGI